MFARLISFFFLIVSCSSLKTIPTGIDILEEISIKPGEIIKVGTLPNANIIKCGEEKLFPFEVGNKKYYLFAESYFSSRESIECEIYQGEKLLFSQKISVVEKIYPFEKLSVNPKRVKLNDKDLKRVLKERKILKEIYSKRSKDLIINRPFRIPLNSKVTSNYGTRRLFNNVKKSQHLGIDYRAKIGVPIPSSNKGVVVLARDLFYTGNTVILDHGAGVFTLYGHLNVITAMEGKIVEQGEIIGKAGKTGRVTGPHLHWGVKVNGHWVNGDVLTNLDLP